jgi:hypothetical protein
VEGGGGVQVSAGTVTDLKRYDWGDDGMEGDQYGDYVLHSDAQALIDDSLTAKLKAKKLAMSVLLAVCLPFIFTIYSYVIRSAYIILRNSMSHEPALLLAILAGVFSLWLSWMYYVTRE